MEEKEEKSREELLQKKYMDEVACLFPKSFTCPVCDENFKSLAVRKSKMYSLGMDEDLRPKYRWVDPIKYEIIVCPVCGYSAMARYFDEMTPAWRKMLQNGLPSLGIQRGSVEPERLTYDEALKQFELACKCNELVAFKESRKAYTFLKRGWVIRGKILDEQDFLSKEELDKLKKTEKQCLSIAYVGFVKALSEEDFPVAGMDEHTLMYLSAALASRIERYSDAMTILSRLMSSRNVNPRVKDKAYDLKEIVSERLKEQESASK